MKVKSKPLFVAISDVHYSLQNLELSDRSFRAAIDKAAELKVPLVDCGDLTNDKAILRGEIVNRLIDTMSYANSKGVPLFLLVGNHSLINERGSEHVINFLRPYAHVVDFACQYAELPGVLFVPYQSDITNYRSTIRQRASRGDIIICHQGTTGANMGDYIQDKSAIDVKILRDYTAISGHYHQHQTVGTLTYCGSPFTMSFGEANDGPKGFLVVNEDGSFTREILNLRKHIIIEAHACIDPEYNCVGVVFKPPRPVVAVNDLVWVKLHGSKSNLDNLNKKDIKGHFFIPTDNFKLDKIVTEDDCIDIVNTKTLTGEEILDKMIDAKKDSDSHKSKLKKLWREAIS